MNIPHSRRFISFLTAIALSIILSACADSNTPTDEIDTTEAQLRAHYEALVLALRTELSDLRGDAYITNATLQNRVDALEAVLESLGANKPPVEEETKVVPETVVETKAETKPIIETEPATEPVTEPITEPATEPETMAETIAETMVEILTETETKPEGNHEPETKVESDGKDEIGDKVEIEIETTHPFQDAITDHQYLYTISNGKATIIGFLYDSTLILDGHLAVPATLGGYPVTSIADNAFAGLPVTYVMLPSTLTHIGWFAFSGCLELHVLAVPDTVSRIDYGAFESCPNLTVYCPRGSYTARYTAACAVPYVET